MSETAGQSLAAANMSDQNSAFASCQTTAKSTTLKSMALGLDQYFAAAGRLVMRGAWSMAWRRERVKVLKRSVLRAAPTVWSRANLMIVFVRESLGGDLSLPFFSLESGDGLDGGGLGCAGNVDSRKSCLCVEVSRQCDEVRCTSGGDEDILDIKIWRAASESGNIGSPEKVWRRAHHRK